LDQIPIQLTLADLQAAQRLHIRAVSLRTLLYYALFLTVVGAFFSWSLPRHAPTDILAALVTVTLVGTAFLAALNLISRWFILPIRARRIFNQQKNLQRPYRVSWDAESVQTSSASGNSKIPWVDFLKWRESKQLFLLYRSDVLFQMYPKRCFTPEQIDEFRLLAKRNIAEIAGRKRKRE
jgi:hypothetical protein